MWNPRPITNRDAAAGLSPVGGKLVAVASISSTPLILGPDDRILPDAVPAPPARAAQKDPATTPARTPAETAGMPNATQLYEHAFGLRERPFTLVPDPEFLFWAPQHRNAFSVLEFGVLSRAPITLVTGEIGSGKTTLLQALLHKIETDLTVGLISNAQGGRGELLQWVLNAFGIESPTESYVRQCQALQDFLVAEYAAGRRVLLIVDEAQNLSVEGLEEIRMLTNINANKDELIQLILVGQPELRDIVRQPNMRQLAQRVAASFHLTPMDAATTTGYIAHRLRVAGGTGAEFTPEAADLVHRHTGGVPRLVNQLCDFAMLYAWSSESRLIDAELIENVIADGVFFGDVLAETPDPDPAAGRAAAAAGGSK